MISVPDDFHEVATLVGIETVRTPVVEDQQVGLDKRAEQTVVLAVGAGHLGDAHGAEEGNEVAIDQAAVAVPRGRLPPPPLATLQLLGEIGE